MTGTPPPHVEAAAAVVEAFLQGQPAAKVSDEQFAKMGPGERLDYARQFEQSKFGWTDKRAPQKSLRKD